MNRPCKSSSLLPVLLCICIGTTILPTSINGQAISGDLVGTVTDTSGAVIPGAIVTATNIASNIQSSATSNSTGQYRLSNLLPGDYNVTAAASGFTTFNIKGVPVKLNETATVNIALSVGPVSSSVDVVADTVIDTTTAQIQTNYEGKQIADLPTNTIGVGVINMSLLQAGVSSAGGIGVGTGPSVGGQRPRNNNFTIEGVDNNRKDVTGPNTAVPSESVAEWGFRRS